MHLVPGSTEDPQLGTLRDRLLSHGGIEVEVDNDVYFTNSCEIANEIKGSKGLNASAAGQALDRQVKIDRDVKNQDFRRFSEQASDYYSDFLGIISDQAKAGMSPFVDLGQIREDADECATGGTGEGWVVELFSRPRVNQLINDFGGKAGASFDLLTVNIHGEPYDIRLPSKRKEILRYIKSSQGALT